MNRIKAMIKQVIIDSLIGSQVSYRGQLKRFVKYTKFWEPGFKLIPDFDLSEIPEKGPVIINVKFSLWGLIDIDGNEKRQVNIGADFGPLTVYFENPNFKVDSSKASFSNFEIE